MRTLTTHIRQARYVDQTVNLCATRRDRDPYVWPATLQLDCVKPVGFLLQAVSLVNNPCSHLFVTKLLCIADGIKAGVRPPAPESFRANNGCEVGYEPPKRPQTP
jgi:hypothetical protein